MSFNINNINVDTIFKINKLCLYSESTNFIVKTLNELNVPYTKLNIDVTKEKFERTNQFYDGFFKLIDEYIKSLNSNNLDPDRLIIEIYQKIVDTLILDVDTLKLKTLKIFFEELTKNDINNSIQIKQYLLLRLFNKVKTNNSNRNYKLLFSSLNFNLNDIFIEQNSNKRQMDLIISLFRTNVFKEFIDLIDLTQFKNILINSNETMDAIYIKYIQDHKDFLKINDFYFVVKHMYNSKVLTMNDVISINNNFDRNYHNVVTTYKNISLQKMLIEYYAKLKIKIDNFTNIIIKKEKEKIEKNVLKKEKTWIDSAIKTKIKNDNFEQELLI